MEMPEETATVEQAAAAIGSTQRQIVKSLLLVADSGPILVLAAGDRRVDVAHVARQLGLDSVRMARAEEVKRITGFSIGGVAPFGHDTVLPTYLDERLLAEDIVYAAAGTRFRVFAVGPAALLELAAARVIQVSG